MQASTDKVLPAMVVTCRVLSGIVGRWPTDSGQGYYRDQWAAVAFFYISVALYNLQYLVADNNIHAVEPLEATPDIIGHYTSGPKEWLRAQHLCTVRRTCLH